MKLYFMPKSWLGDLSTFLALAFFLFLGAGTSVAASGQTGGNTIFDNLWISIPMILAGLSAIAAFATGLASIIKEKERAILVYMTTFAGLLVICFLIGELVAPH